jgi:hypothetical protein
VNYPVIIPGWFEETVKRLGITNYIVDPLCDPLRWIPLSEREPEDGVRVQVRWHYYGVSDQVHYGHRTKSPGKSMQPEEGSWGRVILEWRYIDQEVIK